MNQYATKKAGSKHEPGMRFCHISGSQLHRMSFRQMAFHGICFGWFQKLRQHPGIGRSVRLSPSEFALRRKTVSIYLSAGEKMANIVSE